MSRNIIKPPKYYIILNPAAGAGKGQRYLPRLQDIANESGGCIEVAQYPGHASVLARQLAKAGRLLFAAGGDDTIRETLEGMFGERDCTLGIIPLGTFNNFAASLWLPPDPVVAFQAALAGQDHYIDVGKIENGPLFIESIGIGIDADAWCRAPVREPQGWQRWLLGLRLGWKTLWDFKPQSYRLTADGRSFTINDVMQITVANSRCFGSGIQIAPNARLDDGLLDICIIKRIGKLKFLAMLPFLYFGRHIDFVSRVKYFQCRKISIETRRHLPVRVDGMICAQLPVKIQALHNSLKMRLPSVCLEQRLAK